MLKTTGWAFALIVAFTMLGGAAAWAADMNVLGTNARGDVILGVEGEIKADDSKKFLAATAKLPRVILQLDSPGGLVGEAIGIAQVARARGYPVAVAPKTLCASACALIWLSATERYASLSGKVGFHAVFSKDTKAVAASGNALVGAFFARLGVSDAVIAYITTAPPRDMSWLTAAKAAELDIAI